MRASKEMADYALLALTELGEGVTSSRRAEGGKKLTDKTSRLGGLNILANSAEAMLKEILEGNDGDENEN